jgi:hypothetical protein
MARSTVLVEQVRANACQWQLICMTNSECFNTVGEFFPEWQSFGRGDQQQQSQYGDNDQKLFQQRLLFIRQGEGV